MTEIYLVAAGNARALIDHEQVDLVASDVLVVEPGEAHTFVESSFDYRHFVVHVPGLHEQRAVNDKVPVARERFSP